MAASVMRGLHSLTLLLGITETELLQLFCGCNSDTAEFQNTGDSIQTRVTFMAEHIEFTVKLQKDRDLDEELGCPT